MKIKITRDKFNELKERIEKAKQRKAEEVGRETMQAAKDLYNKHATVPTDSPVLYIHTEINETAQLLSSVQQQLQAWEGEE